MATITLTPSNYYQVSNGIVTAKNPSKKYPRVNETGTNNDYVYVEFDLPSSVKHVLVSDNQIIISGADTNLFVTCRQPYESSPIYTSGISVGDILYNDGKIISKESWRGDDAIEHERVASLTDLPSQKFYVIVAAAVLGYYDIFYFTSCTLKLTYTASSTLPTLTLSPQSGFVDPQQSKTFTVSRSSVDGLLMQYSITRSTFYYRLSGGSSYTSREFTTASSIEVPANTFSGASQYQIYAASVLDNDSSIQSQVGTISTEDAVPTVTLISPINEVMYGTATFKWNYSISTGTPQKAIDIQTSTDGSTWADLLNHEETTATSYTSDIAASGTVYWRARGYNQDNVASAWSEVASFVNNIPPEAPTITSISATGRPVITWGASNQIAYQVQILLNGEVLEDSGAVYSSGAEYRAEEYLVAGSYVARVRIYNEYGRISDWAEIDCTVPNVVTAPTFTVTSTDGGALIEITTVPAIGTYYIKRNGALIGRAVNGRYVDRFASGPTTYTVVAVTSEDYDAMSAQTVNIEVESNMVITEAGEVFEVNHRLGSPVGVSKQVNAVFDTAEFIGASTPEHIFAKMRETRYSVVFKDYVDTESLLGQTVFYADMYGNGDWCAVVSVGRVESRYGNETTAELQVTRHTETAAYD